MLRSWNLKLNHKVHKINFNWLNFYTISSKLILQGVNYSAYYEIYTIRASLLRSSITKLSGEGKSLSNFFIKPSREVRQLSYNSVWHNFVAPTHVGSTILREELPLKSRLFFIQLQFITSLSGEDYVIHAHNRSMFMSYDNQGRTPFINVRKFFKKWIHTYDFLLNLFFSKTCVLMFAPKALKEESISFNWSYGLIPYNLFRYAAPYFFMKNASYGSSPTFAYNRLAYTGLAVSFVADISYHKTNLFHLKTTGFFVIGLVSSNMNPWLVHYTIHSGSNTLFTQYFFIKFMSHLRQQADYYHYSASKSLWYYKQ
jgi:hypothetical protein